MKEFHYEVVEHIQTIAEYGSGDYVLELNLISFNGSAPKYDLRKWNRSKDQMLRGVTLSAEEAAKVAAALSSHLAKTAAMPPVQDGSGIPRKTGEALTKNI